MDMVEMLKQWIISNNIEKRTLDGFWKNYESYRSEYPKEFEDELGYMKKNDLYIEVNSISLDLGAWPKCSFIRASACVPIFYRNREVGRYRMFFTLDGNVQDDMFEIF